MGLDDADVLHGGDGRDTLEGGLRADQLFGGGSRDFMYGNEGFDTLTGGAGPDVMYGGSSADQFVFDLRLNGNDGDRILDFQIGKDVIVIGGVTRAGGAPEVTITVLSSGLQMVTIGDVADPLMEIGVRARGTVVTESDISFLFV